MSACRKDCSVQFASVESWEQQDQEVQKIIKEDIGNDSFGIQESLPPKYICKLTQEAIDKLNLLPGVTVKVKEKGV